jgi:hypothetical protein
VHQPTVWDRAHESDAVEPHLCNSHSVRARRWHNGNVDAAVSDVLVAWVFTIRTITNGAAGRLARLGADRSTQSTQSVVSVLSCANGEH